MYYYIVDPQKISQREFERVQYHLYSSLSDYHISGEVVRVTSLRSVVQLVENAFAHEATTLVAVGNDETLHEVINAVGRREMVIGFIPLSPSEIGDMLGIKNLLQAVKSIAHRRVENLDQGIINNYFFLSKITFGAATDAGLTNFFKLPVFEIGFSGDDVFHANQEVIGGTISNSRLGGDENMGSPGDGLLDVLLVPKISGWSALRHWRELISGKYKKIPMTSVVHAKKITISSPIDMPLKIGDKIVAKSPAEISVIQGMLKIIVGKDRDF